ncbi:MAG: hypothetical protein WAX30_15835 [Citrobacter portucalensis]
MMVLLIKSFFNVIIAFNKKVAHPHYNKYETGADDPVTGTKGLGVQYHVYQGSNRAKQYACA